MKPENAELLDSALNAIVAKHSLRNLRAMLILAFAAGSAFATFQFQIWKMSATIDSQQRNAFTQQHYDTAAAIFNAQNPVVKLPYYREVRERQ